MQVSNMRKFLDAMESAGIKEWVAIVDTPTNFYNNSSQFNIFDEEEEALINFARPIPTGTTYFDGDIVVKTADIVDIHELRIGGSYKEICDFIDAYGMTLTDEQNKILLEIYKNNYNLKPANGDYTFRKLSESEIAKLSTEEKTAYQAALAEYEAKSMPFPVQVTL